MIFMTAKRKTALILTWGFVLFCMALIFHFSHQNASDSSETSSGLIKEIFYFFKIELSSHFIRKTAHAIEFGGLCFAFNLAYCATFLKFSPFVSLASTVFYASTDELHQYFIEGRACQLRDIFVDFCGAVLVTAAITVLYLIYKSYKEKRGVKNVSFKTV